MKSAARAFQRAQMASRLRHALVQQGRRGARLLADIKLAAARRARELAPEMAVIGIDGSYQIGLLTLRWHGLGAMHVMDRRSLGAGLETIYSLPHKPERAAV